MKSSLNLSFQHLPILIKRLLIGLAIIGSAVGGWSYWQVQQKIRAAERASNIAGQLCKISETYGQIQELGQGRIEDARQNLNTKLATQLASLDDALGSADENSRAAAEHVVGLIAADQKRNPGYYVATGSETESSTTSTNRHPLH